MCEWINPVISALAALVGAGVGAWGMLKAGKKERDAARADREAARELERRGEIRKEFAGFATAATAFLTEHSMPPAEPSDRDKLQARTIEVQNARIEVVLSAERLGMLLKREERPVLDTLKRVPAAERSRDTAALLEAAMFCIPAWYRGELDISAVKAEFARKVAEFGGPVLPG